MKKIIKLPNEIVSRVAAGEVVERPSSVVKELIENALDAKASQINIEIEKEGLSHIKVFDNGEGMSKDDLEICFLRHTTSKIKKIEDLANINTMGFRGEALYSIAATSKTIIKSKTAGSIGGFEIKIEGSKASQIKPVGIPQGTIVLVENLFFNLPARKKQVENLQNELKHLIQTVTRTALANPNVGFTLRDNKRVLLNLPKNQDLNTRITYLLGKETTSSLIGFEHTDDYVSVRGFLSKPQHTYPNRDFQFLFVNGRSVVNRNVSNLVKEAFSTLIEHKAYPVFLIYLNVPADLVDVNIHPRKSEVEFIAKNKIYGPIQDAIKNALGIKDLTYKMSENKTDSTDVEDFNEFLYGVSETTFPVTADGRKSNPYLASILKESSNTWNIKTNRSQNKYDEVLQVHNLYLITSTPKGILIVDQHAAHERILYEEFIEKFLEEKKKKDWVEVNTFLDLPISLLPVMEKNITTLHKAGIIIEPFRNNTFKISKVEKLFAKHDIRKLIFELLKDVEKDYDYQSIDNNSLNTISYLACRSAIKAGDYLTKQERKNLLTKLAETKTNYTCPHGRPVKIEIEKNQIAKVFKRIK